MADIWYDVDAALSEVPINLLPILDDTDFKSKEESLTYNQAGLDLVWNFVTTAGAMTQTEVTPTDTGGAYDWVNQGNGHYSIEIPASGGASINNDTEGFGWFTGVATGVLPWRSPVFGFRAAAVNDDFIDAGEALASLTDITVPLAVVDANVDLILADTGTDGVVLADDAITSAKFDESTAFPVKSADTGATQIARVGADGDTLETLSDQIDGVQTWASSAISASYASGAISDIRGSSWSIAMTDLTLDTNKQQFCIKRKAQDSDADAILFVDSDTGLITLNGAAGTASDATLVYAGTTLTLTVKTAATAQLPVGTFHYGVQYVTAAGLVEEPYGGTFSITADIVRATT